VYGSNESSIFGIRDRSVRFLQEADRLGLNVADAKDCRRPVSLVPRLRSAKTCPRLSRSKAVIRTGGPHDRRYDSNATGSATPTLGTQLHLLREEQQATIFVSR